MAVLHLSAAQRDTLEHRAALVHPREACGLLVGATVDDTVRVERVVTARNLSPRPHDRYELDPEDFLAATKTARRDGLEIVGIWHSHPDHPAEPSPRDREGAWRGYSYVIVSISARGASELRSWRFDGERFREEDIVVQEPGDAP